VRRFSAAFVFSSAKALCPRTHSPYQFIIIALIEDIPNRKTKAAEKRRTTNRALHGSPPDGSDTDSLSRSFDASLGHRLIPLGSARSLPGSGGTCLLAAGCFWICKQRYCFAQEALRFGIFRPTRVLHPLPQALELGLCFLDVAELLVRHGKEGEVGGD